MATRGLMHEPIRRLRNSSLSTLKSYIKLDKWRSREKYTYFDNNMTLTNLLVLV